MYGNILITLTKGLRSGSSDFITRSVSLGIRMLARQLFERFSAGWLLKRKLFTRWAHSKHKTSLCSSKWLISCSSNSLSVSNSSSHPACLQAAIMTFILVLRGIQNGWLDFLFSVLKCVFWVLPIHSASCQHSGSLQFAAVHLHWCPS